MLPNPGPEENNDIDRKSPLETAVVKAQLASAELTLSVSRLGLRRTSSTEYL